MGRVVGLETSLKLLELPGYALFEVKKERGGKNMVLDDECKEMLSGKFGRLVKGAMEFLVKLGRAYQATDMVNIDFGFVYTTADFLTSKDSSLNFLTMESLQEAIDLGVKVRTPSISGLGALDCDCCDLLQIPEEAEERLMHQIELDKALGLMFIPSCDPYLIINTHVASLGCHMVSVESSAIPYYNSVLGARCNRNGIAAFFAALTGKYPRFGYHLTENRRPSHLFIVKAKLQNYIDYGVLGLIAGEKVGPEVGAFIINENPMPYELVHFGSGLSSGGPVTMYHIIGITPEARYIEGGIKHIGLNNIHEITDDDIRRVYNKHSGKDEAVNFVILGCPYYDVFELKRVADLMKGKKIRDHVSLWIHVDPLAKATAETSGFAKYIYDAGGHIICGTCPQLSAGIPGPTYTFTHPEYSIGTIATDSIKQAHYSGLILRARKCLIGEVERCIEAAIRGTWR